MRDALGQDKPPNLPNASDESVANFIRRKFGSELLEKLVGPFVSGIYAGNPEKLGLRSAFPQLYDAENSRGSVVRGLLRGKKSGPRTLASFAGGNQVLTDALAASLGAGATSRLRRNSRCALAALGPGRFMVEFAASGESADAGTIYTDHVIVATPAPAAGRLLAELDAKFAPFFEAISYVPMAVVSLGYRREAVTNSLHGFGFLAPRGSGLRNTRLRLEFVVIRGSRARGFGLLTSFVGGAFDSGAALLPPQELQNIVHQELRRVLGISESPVIANVQIWPQAIPQYDLEHFRRGITFSQKVAGFPGLALAGNYLDGPAVGTVVDRARKVADYVLDGAPR